MAQRGSREQSQDLFHTGCTGNELPQRKILLRRTTATAGSLSVRSSGRGWGRPRRPPTHRGASRLRDCTLGNRGPHGCTSNATVRLTSNLPLELVDDGEDGLRRVVLRRRVRLPRLLWTRQHSLAAALARVRVHDGSVHDGPGHVDCRRARSPAAHVAGTGGRRKTAQEGARRGWGTSARSSASPLAATWRGGRQGQSSGFCTLRQTPVTAVRSTSVWRRTWKLKSDEAQERVCRRPVEPPVLRRASGWQTASGSLPKTHPQRSVRPVVHCSACRTCWLVGV